MSKKKGTYLQLRWFLILLLLGGCVRIPEHELALADSSAGFSETVETALQTGSFETGEWVQENWWERFEDPFLTALIEEGLKKSPNLKFAEERLKAAAQVALQKRAALFPEIDLDATDVWQHFSRAGLFRSLAPSMPATINDVTIGLSFHYEFDFWGKNRDLFDAALGEASARAFETMQARLVMTTAIAYTYFEWQFLLKKQEILQERKGNRTMVLGVRDVRERNAVDTALDSLAAEADTLEIDAALKNVQIEIDLHVHQLKALAGMSQDAPLEREKVSLRALRLALPKTLGLDLLARRPDLMAQKKRVEAAAHKIDAAKTNFYPNINLLAFLGTESILWPQLFRAHNWNVLGNPAIHLPIFTAGRIRAELYEQVSFFNEAVYVYNELILQATKEVADSLTTITTLLEQIALHQKILNVADQERFLVRRLFEGALANRIDTLKAIDQTLEKKLLLTGIEYATQLAEIVLIRNLGGGFHE